MVQVTAPSGGTWTRREGARSTGAELLQVLEELPRMGDVSRQWNWWQEGRRDQEYGRLRRIISEWDNGAPEVTEEEAEALAQAEMDKLDERLEAKRRRRADLVAPV